MTHIFARLAGIGTDEALPHESRRIRLTNIVSVLIVLFIAGYTAFFSLQGHWDTILFDILICLFYLSVLGLNQKKFNRLASIVLLCTAIVELTVTSNVFLGPATGIHYFFFAIPTFSFLLLHKKDKPWILLLATLSLSMFLYTEYGSFTSSFLVEVSENVQKGLHIASTTSTILLLFVVVFLFHRYLNRALEDREETLRQLRETQNHLVMQEKMASLGKLVAGVAHEINNPIGAVNSSVDNADRCIDKILDVLGKGETGEAVGGEGQLAQLVKVLKDNTRNALTAGERIAQVVKSLKAFARLDEAEYQKVDLHEGLDSTLTLQQHELKDRIHVVRTYGEIPEIDCYAGELNQVFMNLLVNAIQAIEGEGTIRIETSADSEYVYVKISDTGKGILPENMDQIFDPGFTTRGSGVGTGLGLSTSYNIVQKHEGEIEVESEVGKGSTFTVRIPMVYRES